MYKLSTKRYRPVAVKDFVVSSDWLCLVIYDKDEISRRWKSVESHVEADDYFGTLATIIDLIRQEPGKINAKHKRIMESLKDDLVFLQENYRIIEK